MRFWKSRTDKRLWAVSQPMRRRWTVVVVPEPGGRPRRLVLSHMLVVGALALIAFGLMAGLWAGWQVGELTSDNRPMVYEDANA